MNQSVLSAAAQFRGVGSDLILITSDRRLLKAAQLEGLVTFDPEAQDQNSLDSLLGP